MKIDVEGVEHLAMRRAGKLLRDVTYVMMEWREMKRLHGAFENHSEDKRKVQEMIAMLVQRRYAVQCALTGKPLSVNHWYGWPDNVLWVLQQ